MSAKQKTINPVELAEERLKELAEIYLSHAKVSLFGSRARLEGGRCSDFDLAVYPQPGFRREDLTRFKCAVEDDPKIIYKIEVVNIEDIDPEWREKIESEAIEWKS